MKIVEVGPRDGLQNETASIPTDVKIAFVNALSRTGVCEIEVSAFVSPRRVPQLADAGAVFRGIDRQAGIVYSALVPNQKGLERAINAGVDKISVFTAASETFNRKNINTSVAGSLRRFQPIVRLARQSGLLIRGYISTAFWCAFEGKISPDAVIDLTERLLDLGIDEVSISDTIGKATPEEVSILLESLLSRIAPEFVAVHFHDTYGRGVENVLTSLNFGIRTFDASVGGIGGCPFAPGATGNVATEAVVKALQEKGALNQVKRKRLAQARRLLDPFLTEERRSVPKGGTAACAVCEFYNGDTCCGRKDRIPGSEHAGSAHRP